MVMNDISTRYTYCVATSTLIRTAVVWVLILTTKPSAVFILVRGAFIFKVN